MADSFKQFMANAFGGQTAPAMTEEELRQTGINPAAMPQPPQPSLMSQIGSGVDNFFGTLQRGATPEADLGYAPPSAGDVLASAGIRAQGGGIVGDPTRTDPDFGPAPMLSPNTPQAPQQAAPQPQVPTMESLGGRTPQFGNFEVSSTPSILPTATSPQPMGAAQTPFQGDAGVQETQRRLGAMFGEAPQTLSQVTAQDPASIAAQQASESFGMESAAREARLPEVGEFRERAVPDASNMRGERQYTDSQIRDLAGGDAEVMGRMKAMDEQGIDPATGKSRADAGLTFSEKLAQDKFNFDVDKFSYEQAKEAQGEAVAAQQSQDSAKFAARDMLRQHQNVMNKAQRAGKNIGFTTTGAVGALLGLAPGTKAYDQKATVETLQADAAFESLRKMREASKTGGALGQVSERELALLESAVGNLKTGQSGQQFKQNLNEYINMRNDAMLNVYDAFTADYGEANANEAFGIGSRDDLMGEGASQRGSGTAVESASGRYEVEVI